MSKHEALKAWVSQFLEDNYLYFQTADTYPGTRTLVPNYGDYVDRTDILGNKYKSYTFLFIGYETLDTGTSDINIENMEVFDKFTEWLEYQIENHIYPDFGDKCSEYEIEPIQNMARLANITDDNLAEYILGVRINYKEES